MPNDVEMADPVSVIVSDAGNGIAQALAAQIEDQSQTDAAGSCRDYVNNIGMAAELAQLTGLKSVCDAVVHHLGVYSGEAGLPKELGYCLVDWVGDVLAYLQEPGDPALAQKLLAPLPEHMHQAELLQQLTDAVQSDAGDEPEPGVEPVVCCSESDDTAAMAFDEFPAEQVDPGTASGVLAILQEELAEVSQELSSLAQRMTDTSADDEAAMQAAFQYSTILGRISNACESLGLTGLRDVCTLVDDNIGRTACFEPGERAQVRAVLLAWPSLVLTYLNEPTDDNKCLAVINCLQDDSWPMVLTDTAAQALLVSLAAEMVEPDFDEQVELRETEARPEDIALQVADDVNQELVDAFFHESPGLAENLSERIGLIEGGENLRDNVAAAQRLAHTLKGSANLLAIKGVANLMHHMEDILEYLSGEQQIQVTGALSYSLQEAADCVETMIDALQGKDTAPGDAQRILQDLLDWANLADSGQLESAQADSGVESNKRHAAEQAAVAEDRKQKAAPAAQGVSEEVLRVSTRTVDDLFRMVGEMSIAIGQTRERLKGIIRQGEEMRIQDTAVQQRRFELEDMVDVRSMSFTQRRMRSVVGGENGFDSLEMDQYDELYGSAHSFIESVSDYREMMLRLQNGLSDLDGLFLQQQRLNKELQRVVMSTRMVPVGNIASRLQRSVRQACRATGKQAELHLRGGDLLLDGDALNKLTDPIMHMLRNAVDHGIEFADQREATGKDATGKLVLTFQQDGNTMLVSCEDDGCGLDYKRIRATAEKRGLIDANAILDPQETARLILTPGFSTRETATHTSGRGVGMDVVNNTVKSLNGSMDIGDSDAAGCRITLRLPITLVTSHAVLVRNGDDLLAIPTSSLSQILAPGTGGFDIIGSGLTYKLGKDMYPVHSVADLLGSAGGRKEPRGNDARTVLLVHADEGLVAVTVDQVVNSYDLVIKSTGRYVQHVHGVAGVSILGDGSVVPVLNLPELLRKPPVAGALSVESHADEGRPLQQSSPLSVLIVDDSLSVRKSLSQLVADAGYQPIAARDGLEAVELLAEHKPDIVLADLEMPRMTGLELTSHIRADGNLADLPVIMITSRTMQKHRQQAEKAGVSDYMTKPFSEDDLLAAMESALRVH